MFSFYGFLLASLLMVTQSMAALHDAVKVEEGAFKVRGIDLRVPANSTTSLVRTKTPVPDTSETCCPEDKFECDNGKCISPCQACNGFNNCGDRSDERYCTNECDGQHHFLCDNGKCYRSFVKCNGADDCGDGSDEANC